MSFLPKLILIPICFPIHKLHNFFTFPDFNPIEFLNNSFGIKNDVSVPVIVSLVVFITGGIASFIFDSIKNYFSRKGQRTSFKNIITEVQSKAKKMSKNLSEFYPSLNERHGEAWKLQYSKIGYLDVLSQLDYNVVFNAFNERFFYMSNRNIRSKAFNKIWAVLGNLKFTESLIEDNYKNFIKEVNLHENKYGEHLEELRKAHDKFHLQTQGEKVPKGIYEHLMAQDKIWVEWQKADNPTFYQTTITKLVEPLLQLNRSNQVNISYVLEQNNILLAASHEHDEIVSKLTNYKEVFFNYYLSYKNASRILEKCLKIIS